jgi:hypothetical protein
MNSKENNSKETSQACWALSIRFADWDSFSSNDALLGYLFKANKTPRKHEFLLAAP